MRASCVTFTATEQWPTRRQDARQQNGGRGNIMGSASERGRGVCPGEQRSEASVQHMEGLLGGGRAPLRKEPPVR